MDHLGAPYRRIARRMFASGGGRCGEPIRVMAFLLTVCGMIERILSEEPIGFLLNRDESYDMLMRWQPAHTCEIGRYDNFIGSGIERNVGKPMFQVVARPA